MTELIKFCKNEQAISSIISVYEIINRAGVKACPID